VLLERGFLRPRARRSRRRSAHRSRSSPIPPVTCVGRDSMSPPSSPTRTPSTAGGSGAGRDSACCAGRLRPPPPWARSDSAAAVLRGRRPRARWARSGAFPQVARKAEARFGGFLASILRMSRHQLKACIPHHMVSARYSDFAICSCGGILQICQWYRVCDAGALRAEPLGHPLYLARSIF
jgi:hypothetical protein